MKEEMELKWRPDHRRFQLILSGKLGQGKACTSSAAMAATDETPFCKFPR